MAPARKFSIDRLDGRWFLTGSHVTLVVSGYFFYHLQRSLFQIVSVVVVCVLAEVLAARGLGRFAEFKPYDRILSGLAIAFGLLVLVRSYHPYYYALAGLIAVLSKYLIRRPDGQHIFNPTNFAIVSTFACLPLGTFSSFPDEFTIQAWPYVSVCAFGLAATYLSGRWRVALAYAIGNVCLAFALAPVFHLSFLYLLAPDLGVLGLIFMFLMITDPRTTPKTPRGMFLFGAAVAFFNITLRDFEIAFSYFVALFLVVILYQFTWIWPKRAVPA